MHFVCVAPNGSGSTRSERQLESACGLFRTSLSNMPTYVYEVIREDGEPGAQFETVQPIKDPPLRKHPETGEPVQRVIQPVFMGGTWTESSMSRRLKDDKKLDKLGLTKYVKAGDGMYEKRSGKGPDLISRDQAVKGSDFKHLD